MFFDYRKSVSRTFWLLTLINLVAYACFHTMYNLSNETGVSELLVTVLYYLDIMMTKCCDFILPILISSVALMLYAKCEGRKWLVSTCLLSVSAIFYSYPYYYIYHITLGFSTPEALGYALIASALSILVLVLHSLLLFLAAYLYVRFDKRPGSVKKKITERTVYTERLDLKGGAGFLLFIISLCLLL